MIVFLDTNVIIDFYAKREEFFRPSAILMDLAYQGKISIAVSAITFVNAFFLLRKFYDASLLYEKMKQLHALCVTTPIDASMIATCLQQKNRDFEDAIQVESAKSIGTDVIITRNLKDFQHVDIQVMTPIMFLETYLT
jgi:toxin-antitoxin system, toxin component, PIN family